MSPSMSRRSPRAARVRTERWLISTTPWLTSDRAAIPTTLPTRAGTALSATTAKTRERSEARCNRPPGFYASLLLQVSELRMSTRSRPGLGRYPPWQQGVPVRPVVGRHPLERPRHQPGPLTLRDAVGLLGLPLPPRPAEPEQHHVVDRPGRPRIPGHHPVLGRTSDNAGTD